MSLWEGRRANVVGGWGKGRGDYWAEVGLLGGKGTLQEMFVCP